MARCLLLFPLTLFVVSPGCPSTAQSNSTKSAAQDKLRVSMLRIKTTPLSRGVCCCSHSLGSWSHQDSNLDLEFRKLLFYPLNYETKKQIYYFSGSP